MKEARKIKLIKASANNPKPGEQSQLKLKVGEVVALMPGDNILLKFDQKNKTFAGLYILNDPE